MGHVGRAPRRSLTGYEVDATHDQIGVVSEDPERGQPTGRATEHDGRVRGRPTESCACRIEAGSVVDIEAAPPAVQSLLVRPSVTGGSPRVDDEHVPPAAPPVRDSRPPVDLPLVRRSTVDPDEHPTSAADETSCVENGSSVIRVGRDHLGLGEGVVRPHVGLRQRERRSLPAVSAVEHDLGRRPGAGSQRDQAVVDPAQVTMHAASDLLDDTGPHVDHARARHDHLRSG